MQYSLRESPEPANVPKESENDREETSQEEALKGEEERPSGFQKVELGKTGEQQEKVRGLDEDESLHDNEVDEYFASQQSRQDESEAETAHRIQFRLNSRAQQAEVSPFEDFDLKKNKLVKFGKLKKRSPRKRKESSAAASGARAKESKASLDERGEQGLLRRDKSVRFISSKKLATNFESDPSLEQGRPDALLEGHRSQTLDPEEGVAPSRKLLPRLSPYYRPSMYGEIYESNKDNDTTFAGYQKLRHQINEKKHSLDYRKTQYQVELFTKEIDMTPHNFVNTDKRSQRTVLP